VSWVQAMGWLGTAWVRSGTPPVKKCRVRRIFAETLNQRISCVWVLCCPRGTL
jgi:hypothetical protein